VAPLIPSVPSPPFFHLSFKVQPDLIYANQVKGIPERYLLLAQACWHKNSYERPSFEDAVGELVRIQHCLATGSDGLEPSTLPHRTDFEIVVSSVNGSNPPLMDSAQSARTASRFVYFVLTYLFVVGFCTRVAIKLWIACLLTSFSLFLFAFEFPWCWQCVQFECIRHGSLRRWRKERCASGFD
jgi:hypothetical protein